MVSTRDARVYVRAKMRDARQVTLTGEGLRSVVALWAAAVVAGYAGIASAQDSASEPDASYTQDDLFRFLEDEIEVTAASQMKTKLAEVPQAVYVITREEIERLPALNIADLLRHVPGIVVVNPTHGQWGVGAYWELTPLFTSILLVMVDGRAIYSPFASLNQSWPIPYAPADIERIEIALGPSTTVHGSQAIYGVVNFITRDGAEQGVSGRAVVGGSSGTGDHAEFGDVLSHVAGTVHLGPVRVRGAVGYDRLTPWDTPVSYRDGRAVAQPIAQRGFGNLRAVWQLSKDTTLTAFAGASAFEGPYVSVGAGPLRGTSAHVDSELAMTGLFTDQDQLLVRAYYRNLRQLTEGAFDPLLPPIAIDPDEQIGLARVFYTADLPFDNRLAAALEARVEHSDMSMLPPEGRTYQYYSVFLQDEYRPFEALILNAGIRLETQYRQGLDFFERLVVMPRASVVWLPAPGHSLRLAYGQSSFYQAAFHEFGDARTHRGELLIFEGDPSLTREPVHTWEAGYRGQLLPSLLVTASYSLRVGNSLSWIAQVNDEVLPLRVVQYPGTEVRHALDLTASFRPNRLLRLDAALTWMIYVERPAAFAEAVSELPGWRISGRAHFSPSERVHFDLDAQFVSSRLAKISGTAQPREIAGWLYLNAKLSYQLLAEPDLALFGMLTNITDSKFGDGLPTEMADPGVSRVGRRFLVGLSCEL